MAAKPKYETPPPRNEQNLAEQFIERQEREKELAAQQEKEKEKEESLEPAPVPEQEQTSRPLETGVKEDISRNDGFGAKAIDARQQEAFSNHLESQGVTLDDIVQSGKDSPCQTQPEPAHEQEEELER